MLLLDKIKKQYILRKWRKVQKRDRTLGLKMHNPVAFFSDMDNAGIDYVVLRWPEDVPSTDEQELNFTQDIDVLANISKKNLSILADIAVRHEGRVCCDLYSASGRCSSYLGMPYYPPILARQIIESRCRHPKGFYVPDPLNAFLSFAFHLVYHKGPACGVPTGCDMEASASPKRDYNKRIEELGTAVNADIEPPYSLFKLHLFLKRNLWNMPYDLLERWPANSQWHEFLLKYERGLLEPWAKRLPGLLVFFVRQDAANSESLNFIQKHLSEKFQIVRTQLLSDEQSQRVIRLVRGGNWNQGPDLELVRPSVAIYAYDHNPVSMDNSDEQRKKSYPHVRNSNVFVKQHIRELLNGNSDNGEVYGLHGSDNEFEAQHMLNAIYGSRADEINNQLLLDIKKP